jgi:hypothetical protein
VVELNKKVDQLQ